MSRKVLFAVLSILALPFLADRADAHACVGDWRLAQWDAALADSGIAWEPVRPELVNLPPCSEGGHHAAPVAPAPPPPAEPGTQAWNTGPIADLIAAYFADHPFVSVEQAQRIAWCESRHNPNAKNPTSTASGVWQFLAGTWRWEAGQFGFPTDLDYRFDPETSTALAALVMARDGGPRQWLCKGR